MPEDLLKRIEILPKPEVVEKTFFNHIKISQRETVMAEILAFFFDPNKPHGLGNIFLQALLNTEYHYFHEKKIAGILRDKINSPADGLKNVNVKTEDSTGENKRIDILIETEKLVIAIEFKINHHLNNPLMLYKKHVDEKFKDQEKIFLILTPYWKEPEGKAKEDKEGVFKQVVLSKFIDKVEELSKNNYRIREGQEKYYYFFLDFMQTVKNRRRLHNLIDNYIEDFAKSEEKLQKVDAIYKELINLKNRKDHPELKAAYNNLDEIKSFFKRKVNEVKNLKEMADYSSFGTKGKVNSAIQKVFRDEGFRIKVRLGLKGWTIERWEGEKGDVKKEVMKTGKDFYARPQEIAELVREFEEKQLNQNCQAQE
jgi:hypothetical protein